MNRKNGAIGFCLAMLMFVMCGACPLPVAQAAERSWLQVHYDPDVAAQTRTHVEAAADLIADTTIPWAAEWLHYYELWHMTGEWLAQGVGPESVASLTLSEAQAIEEAAAHVH